VKYLPWVLLLAAVVFGYGYHREQVGKREARIAVLMAQKARVDTVYRRDTLTLTRVRRLTDSVLVMDTLVYRDTVKLYIAAERQACDAVIQTCETRVAIRDSIITVLKKKPSVWSKLPWVAAGVLGGVILSK
jgi:acetyl-CoA carboxylase carboxyltransferase component